MEGFPRDESFTYEDYLTWPNDVRYELIDGKAYLLASPTQAHQRVHGKLFNLIYTFLEGKPCEICSAPYDVRFVDDLKAKDIVQPDIVIVCDKDKDRPEGIVGAPTFVIEIASPSTAVIDLTKKKALYERYGVIEYWIIVPWLQTLSQFLLTDGKYVETFHEDGVVTSASLPGFMLDLAALFAVLPIEEEASTGEDSDI